MVEPITPAQARAHHQAERHPRFEDWVRQINGDLSYPSRSGLWQFEIRCWGAARLIEQLAQAYEHAGWTVRRFKHSDGLEISLP